METQLLQTKLHIPTSRPELVSRPHLVEQLNHGLHRKLTLVSAPAGFGKTTLVSEWVNSSRTQHAEPLQVAWISLDEGDNAATRFLTYLVAALRRVEGIDASFGKGVLNMLQSPQPPPIDTILTSLINEMTAISSRVVLVLDDYHMIDTQTIHNGLTFLLEHMSSNLHLIITTRIDPPVPLARLRGRGQLTELRAADLRFSHSEATEFLNQVMELNLSAEDISALDTRIEGWIAGLQFAALALQGARSMHYQKSTSNLIQSFTGSHRYVLDYLVEEVLNQQSNSVRAFMIQTAFLNRFTSSLCDAVTGQDNSQATLEFLERANLFIVPLDDERRWYRYHHLFADLLIQRLHRTQQEKLPVLYDRAGEWFKQQGLHREAIKHLLAARDYKGASDVIKNIAIDVMQRGEHTTVVEWIDAIPENLVKDQPYLCVLHAWALQLAGQMKKSDTLLFYAEDAGNRLKYDDENLDMIWGLIHSRRAYSTFMTGEHKKTISHAQQALDLLPETATLIRAQSAIYLGAAYHYQGQIQKALDVYHETIPIAQRLGGHSIAVSCHLLLGDLYLEMAQLHRAKAIYEQALTHTEQYTGRPDMPFSGFVYVRIGSILLQWNQLQESCDLITKGLTLCQNWNLADTLALSWFEMAKIQHALNNIEQAQASFNKSIQIMSSFSPWGTQYVTAHMVSFNITTGDIKAAIQWAQANDRVIDGKFEYNREIEYVALARVFIAQQRYKEAHALVERICHIAREIGRRRTELEGLILLAIIFSAQGETNQALLSLEKALAIGEPEGYIRIFVDEGPLIASLLYKALSRGMLPDYVSQLIAAFPASETVQTDKPQTQPPDSNLVEPLSERELEVLQLIAGGMTNQEIAARLYLSTNTVKVHARNIYGKLGVRNRMQAVAKAKGLGILPTT